MNSCKGKIDTDFHNNQTPKEDFHEKCLSMIFIDSVLKRNKNYYHQVFLEECKYIIKEKKVRRYINIDF